ncbi:MAG: hypothetical protein J6O73_13110 [Lachnospiraceae bacterium]|nr:hypothetical protein [Lachnospiraceae bacterium]
MKRKKRDRFPLPGRTGNMSGYPFDDDNAITLSGRRISREDATKGF